MRNFFTFNGTDSRAYGLYISGSGRITIPEPVWNFAEIPGRMGDALIGRERVANELLVYPAFIPPYSVRGIVVPYPRMAGRLRSWLLSVRGYARLSDSYDLAHYRMACFAGPTSFESTAKLDAGSFELSFNCRPQRYLSDESDAFELAAGESHTVDRAGFFYSEPLIEVTGTGSFTVGSQTVTVAANPLTAPIVIDCRLLNCYDKNGVNANRFVSFSDYEFPRISDGTVVTATNVALNVKPRWYEL